jgi:hypothetical protein
LQCLKLSQRRQSQKIKKITAEAQRHRGKANLLLTAPQARLTITKCFSQRLCASAVQSFDFVFNVSSWLKADLLAFSRIKYKAVPINQKKACIMQAFFIKQMKKF